MFKKRNLIKIKGVQFAKVIYLPLFSTLLFSSFPALSSSKTNIQLTKQNIETEFNLLSHSFYSNKVNYTQSSSFDYTNIDEFMNQFDELTGSFRITEAIQLVYNNFETVKSNINHAVILTITELLLKYGDIEKAKNLFQQVKLMGDELQLASSQLIFAKYHASRSEWSEVRKLLENISSDLSAEDYSYALLLKGTALQYLKLHSKAEKVYKKIPIDSKYYVFAQLNTAIAQIRQGWLTNAKATLNKIIIKNSTDEFTNRLYLVLGYALLQKDYYRSARDMFRNVSQKSQYANRALLGIALCAINQKDYESGLHSLSLLKDRKSLDLPVDESYLLVPFVYEKLQQEINVTASSSEALNYYKNRINSLQSIKNTRIDISKLQSEREKELLRQDDYHLNYADNIAESHFTHFDHLHRIRELNTDVDLANQIEVLIERYRDLFQKMKNTQVEQKLSHINSYLNQARYGLARLYDNSNQIIAK